MERNISEMNGMEKTVYKNGNYTSMCLTSHDAKNIVVRVANLSSGNMAVTISGLFLNKNKKDYQYVEMALFSSEKPQIHIDK